MSMGFYVVLRFAIGLWLLFVFLSCSLQSCPRAVSHVPAVRADAWDRCRKHSGYAAAFLQPRRHDDNFRASTSTVATSMSGR